MNTDVPAATGVYTTAIAKLITHLSTSSAVQTRFGTTGNAANTLLRIYSPMAEDEELRDDMPFINVGEGSRFSQEMVAGGGQNYLWSPLEGNAILVELYDYARYAHFDAAYRDFGNYVGAVVGDLVTLAGANDNLNIIAIRRAMQISAASKISAQSIPVSDSRPAGGVYFFTYFEVLWN